MFYASLMVFIAFIVDVLTLPSKASLDKDLEILALRHQLRLLQRQQTAKLRCSRIEKLLLAVLTVKLKTLFKQQKHCLERCLVLFQPDTVLKWHCEFVRQKWTFRSIRKRGRPHTSLELETLVLRLAKENPRWGVDRIHGELLKLGFRPGGTTIRAILSRHGVLPAPQRGANGGSWRKLLRHYKEQLLACDFFTVETALLQTIYVLFFIHIGTRRVYLAGCTAHPGSAWVAQQARQLRWTISEKDEVTPRLLIHDRDTKFSRSFDAVFRSEGTQVLLTPFRTPNANAFAERWVRTVRQECLNHLLVLNEDHLRRVLKEYVLHYNTARPHQVIDQQIPIPQVIPGSGNCVGRRDRLGGIIHEYFRDAA